jgi:hypothetical protein
MRTGLLARGATVLADVAAAMRRLVANLLLAENLAGWLAKPIAEVK